MNPAEELLIAFYKGRERKIPDDLPPNMTQNEIPLAPADAAEFLDGEMNEYKDVLQSFFKRGWAIPLGSKNVEGYYFRLKLTSQGIRQAEELLSSRDTE